MIPRSVVLLSAATAIALVACNGNEPNDTRPASISVLAGNGQNGTPGIMLAESLVVVVRDRAGQPVADVQVGWIGAAGATFGPGSATTDANGRAAASWTLGLAAGEQTAGALVTGLAAAPFTAEAQGLMADSVSGGNGYACARSGTTTYCWGINPLGNLGDGTTNDATVPVAVSGGISWSTVVASSGLHSCGIAIGGVLYCWGNNAAGTTGTGSVAASLLTPTPVASGETFIRVDQGGFSGGGPYACGISTLHKALCWGYNNQGALGTGDPGNQSTPTAVADTFSFASIYPGDDHTCALTPQGAAYCWGLASEGTLGPNSPGIYQSPVPVADGFVFQQLATLSRTVCGLELDGTVDCWGANFFGALGTGTAIDSSVTPVPVAGGLSFKQIVSRAGEAVFALTLDGRLFYWGSPGGDIPQGVPTPYAPTLRFKSIADALVWGNAGFCGIEESGLVYCGEPYSSRLEGVPVP